MALKITNGEVGGVTVVALDGRVVLGEESNSLRENVKALLGQGKKRLVLDMAKVTMIDSSGLGALVGLHSTATSQGASVQLCNLGARFKELLQMTRLLTVFEIASDQAEAVRRLSKGA